MPSVRRKRETQSHCSEGVGGRRLHGKRSTLGLDWGWDLGAAHGCRIPHFRASRERESRDTGLAVEVVNPSIETTLN